MATLPEDVDYPYEATTGSITVKVLPAYIDDQSDPSESRYVWAYHVRVENNGSFTVQLMTRHWIIADGNGRVHEVKGEGVVGEQPVLEPGDVFEYTSGCPLNTPSGIMRGTYGLVDEAGNSFDVEIPAFSLDSPFTLRTIN